MWGKWADGVRRAGLGAAVAAVVLHVVSAAAAQSPSAYARKMWSRDWLKVKLRGSDPTLRLRLSPEWEGDFVGMDCVGACDDEVRPGRYRLDVWAASDSTTREFRDHKLELSDDARIDVDPGDNRTHWTGVFFTVTGAIALVAGTCLLARGGTDPESRPPATPGWIVAGAGAAGFATGITLLIIAKHRIVVTPLPASHVAPDGSAASLAAAREF